MPFVITYYYFLEGFRCHVLINGCDCTIQLTIWYHISLPCVQIGTTMTLSCPELVERGTQLSREVKTYWLEKAWHQQWGQYDRISSWL